MSASQIASHLPTGVEIVRTLLATRGRLKSKQLFTMGLIGWPSDTVHNPLPPQPLHVLNENGEIRMKRAYNVRGGYAPWRPMPTARYPDHPFQGAKFFKTRILGLLEDRSLVRKVVQEIPLVSARDKAEAAAAANKLTRRRQRALAETSEVGLGTGFRTQKSERKEWEAKVYNLPVDRVKPATTKWEWVYEVCGLPVEQEEKYGLQYGIPKSNEATPTAAKEKTDILFAPTLPGIDLTFPSDLLSTEVLEGSIADPTLIPDELRPDPRLDAPLPLPMSLNTPLAAITATTLSDGVIDRRWQSAVKAEHANNRIVDLEKEEIAQRKAERKKMHAAQRINKKRLTESNWRKELDSDPELKRTVERELGKKVDETF